MLLSLRACVAAVYEEQDLNATRVREFDSFRSARSALPVFKDVVTLSALDAALTSELKLLQGELARSAERTAAQRLFVPWQERMHSDSVYRQIKLTYLPRTERAITQWSAVEQLLRHALTGMSDIIGQLLVAFNRQQQSYEADVCEQLTMLVELLAQRIGQLHRQMGDLKIRIEKARARLKKHTINVKHTRTHQRSTHLDRSLSSRLDWFTLLLLLLCVCCFRVTMLVRLATRCLRRRCCRICPKCSMSSPCIRNSSRKSNKTRISWTSSDTHNKHAQQQKRTHRTTDGDKHTIRARDSLVSSVCLCVFCVC